MDSLATTQKFATLDGAARFAGVSVRSLERRIKSHQLEVFHVGRRRLVELDQVEKLVRSGRAAVA
jgi:hypothetical protein